MPRTRLCLLLALTLPVLLSCVYFNTFYNAKKSFRQAEKLRRAEELRLLAGGDQAAQRRRSRGVNSPHEHYERAIVKASKVLEEHRDSDLVDDALFLIGRAFYWQGDYLNSARTFADLNSNFPDSEYALRARFWRGRAHEGQGAFADARRIYRALFRDGGERLGPQAGLRLGEMQAFAQDYTAAIEEYRLTLEAFPKAHNRARLWLKIGDALLAMDEAQRYGEALEAYDQVLENDPSLEEEYRARLNRGRVFFLEGRSDQALATYEKLIKDSRFRRFEGDTRLLIGEYYQETLQLERAIREYERVRDDFPQTEASAMALYRTGLLYLQSRGDLERAREYFKEVPQEKRDSEAVQLSRDRLKDLDQRDRLLAQIERADSTAAAQAAGDSSGGLPVARTPEVQEALFAVAEIYRSQLAQADSATHYLKEALRRFPDDRETPRTLYNLAWIARQLKGDEAASLPYLERLLEDYPYSEQANEARRILDRPTVVTDEEKAQQEYTRLERAWLAGEQDAAAYIAGLDSLARRYADTRTAVRALFAAARVTENALGDSVAADARFARVAEEYPRTTLAELVKERQEARQKGLWEKMERDLMSIGAQLRAGEALEVITVEPDSADSNALALKHFGYAVRAHRRGVLREAREEYEWSLEQVVRNPKALYYLGRILQQEGQVHDAKEYFHEALRYRGGMVGPLFGLAASYTGLAMADSATFFLREAVKRDRRSLLAEELRTAYPDELTDPEPRDLELEVLETLELDPEEEPPRLEASDFKLRELPLVRKSVQPEYPAGANGDTARVIVDILVATDGRPELVEVYRGAEPFAAAAVQAAQKYTFFPAEAAGQRKVPVWVEVEFPFSPPPGWQGRIEAGAGRVDSVAALPAGAGYGVPYSAPADSVNGRDSGQTTE